MTGSNRPRRFSKCALLPCELPVTLWRVTRGEHPGRLLDFYLLDEHALLAVGKVRLAAARRVDEARRGLLKAQRVVDAREVYRVLDAPHHHRLLVVGRVGGAPLFQENSAALAARVLRVEDYLRAARRGPAHGLRVAPALVANRHAELDAARFKELPRVSGHVKLIFARV